MQVFTLILSKQYTKELKKNEEDQKFLDYNRLHSWTEFTLLRFLEQSLSKDMDQGFSKLDAQLFLLITIVIHVKD